MRHFVIFSILLVLSINSYSQHYKKDGSLDMRYRENKTYSPQSYNSNSSVRYQNGYTKSNNTYVQPHYKTNINSTNRDNFSVNGNSNPYTGKKGTRAADYSSKSYNYCRFRSMFTPHSVLCSPPIPGC